MIKNIRVMAADIDGTLCLKGEIPKPRTIAAIRKLHEEGVLFGPASGRPLDHRILNLAQAWDLGFDFDFAIGMNGGDLWTKETGEFEHFCQIKKEVMRSIMEWLWPFDLNIIVYKNAYDEIRAKRMDDFLIDSRRRNNSHVAIGDIDFLCEYDTGKIEVHLKDNCKEEVMAAVRAHEDGTWNCVKTFEMADHTTIEFQDPRLDKGIALEEYAKKLNVPMDEVIAFGDQDNDMGLMRAAGWGVCLANGSDRTKELASAITEYTCEEDGVGRYLEDHWFNQ